jgi:hypothetical protein
MEYPPVERSLRASPRRPPAASSASAMAVAAAAAVAAIIVVLIVIYYCSRKRREGFTSRRAQEVYQTSRDLFDRTGGGATYSEYKMAIRNADPVLYTDVRHLWKKKQLTPEEVAKIL